jgi:hypothetical protein
MPNTIPDLWPNDIDVTEVLTPLAIMRYQAGQLRQRTKSLLEAEVDTEEPDGGKVVHHFDIVAPALDRYRYRLFTVSHDRALVYPVTLSAPWQDDWNQRDEEASTQDEFVKRMAGLLTSDHVKSVIQSLVAQSNESKQPTRS